MDASGSACPPPRPVAIDGGDEDSALVKSRVLTREEVLRRRLRRVRQLRRCYRAHYWAMMEELRSKHREYYWTYGKCPFKEDDGEGGGGESANGVVCGDDIVRCRFSGCKTKAMALTNYCHAHILGDPKQKLYMGCKAVAKNLTTGPSFCNKPILKSMVPPSCPSHFQFSERCLARALRKAGLGNAIAPNRKPNVKFHVIAFEFVHQIQNKRKLALKETATTIKKGTAPTINKGTAPKVETE